MEPVDLSHELLRERDLRIGAQAERDRLAGIVAEWEPWLQKMRAELAELRPYAARLRDESVAARADAQQLRHDLSAVMASREFRLGRVLLRPIRWVTGRRSAR